MKQETQENVTKWEKQNQDNITGWEAHCDTHPGYKHIVFKMKDKSTISYLIDQKQNSLTNPGNSCNETAKD